MKKYAGLYSSIRQKIATNLVLGVLVLSVGALCLSPVEQSVTAKGEGAEIYRRSENGDGVCLMFNVYWGTEEVYRILDTLSAYGATATFFIGGCWADDNTECLKAICNAGHELGNHGYFHKDHSKLSLADNRKEIADCNRFIELATGTAPTLFAPPSGAYGDNALEAAKLLNMKTILWSKDTIDWRDKNAALIYTRATKGVKAGDFILMHPMKETADALEDILKFYKASELKTLTVSQSLQKEG